MLREVTGSLSQLTIDIIGYVSAAFFFSLLGGFVVLCILYYYKVEKKRYNELLHLRITRNEYLKDIAMMIQQLPSNYIKEVLDDEKQG